MAKVNAARIDFVEVVVIRYLRGYSVQSVFGKRPLVSGNRKHQRIPEQLDDLVFIEYWVCIQLSIERVEGRGGI